MAKGQKKSNKEIRKPKQEKAKEVQTTASGFPVAKPSSGKR